MNDDYTQEDLNNDLQALIDLGLIERTTLEGGVPAYRTTQKALDMKKEEIETLVRSSLGK
jgi:hypothetical protein